MRPEWVRSEHRKVPKCPRLEKRHIVRAGGISKSVWDVSQFSVTISRQNKIQKGR